MTKSYDAMETCAAMTLAAAVEDMAEETGRPIREVWKELTESPAYECLLDFDSGLWGEGPDYFRDYNRRVNERVRV